MPGKPSADIFGSFLEAMQDAPRRSSAGFARGGSALGAGLGVDRGGPAKAETPDLLRTVTALISARSEPATIADLYDETKLPLDQLAVTLKRGVDSGLLAPVTREKDGARVFDVTAVGRSVS